MEENYTKYNATTVIEQIQSFKNNQKRKNNLKKNKENKINNQKNQNNQDLIKKK